jgi:hypothetical protein
MRRMFSSESGLGRLRMKFCLTSNQNVATINERLYRRRLRDHQVGGGTPKPSAKRIHRTLRQNGTSKFDRAAPLVRLLRRDRPATDKLMLMPTGHRGMSSGCQCSGGRFHVRHFFSYSASGKSA